MIFRRVYNVDLIPDSGLDYLVANCLVYDAVIVLGDIDRPIRMPASLGAPAHMHHNKTIIIIVHGEGIVPLLECVQVAVPVGRGSRYYLHDSPRSLLSLYECGAVLVTHSKGVNLFA